MLREDVNYMYEYLDNLFPYANIVISYTGMGMGILESDSYMGKPNGEIGVDLFKDRIDWGDGRDCCDLHEAILTMKEIHVAKYADKLK